MKPRCGCLGCLLTPIFLVLAVLGIGAVLDAIPSVHRYLLEIGILQYGQSWPELILEKLQGLFGR